MRGPAPPQDGTGVGTDASRIRASIGTMLAVPVPVLRHPAHADEHCQAWQPPPHLVDRCDGIQLGLRQQGVEGDDVILRCGVTWQPGQARVRGHRLLSWGLGGGAHPRRNTLEHTRGHS